MTLTLALSPSGERVQTLFFRHSRGNDRKAAIDIGYFAGHRAREIGQQKRRDVADFVDGHIATQRRRLFDEAENLREPADTRGRERFDRPGRGRVDADAFGSEAWREWPC